MVTFFSSSEIYGDPDLKHIPIPESYRGNVSVAGPRSCYDESKRLGETLCYIFHSTHGIATNTIRPFNVFGPGMQETDYRVLPNFASRIKGNKPLHIYGSGRQTRTFTYITDALEGFLRTITRGVPGEAYNIGGKTTMKIGEMLDMMIKMSTKQITIHQDPARMRPSDVTLQIPDISKFVNKTNWEPVIPVEQTFQDLLDYWRKVTKN